MVYRVFYLNPFLVVVPTIIFALFFREKRDRRIQESLHRTDWIGMVLITVSCALILYSLLFGGAVLPWSAVAILIPLILGAAGAVAFVVQQSLWIGSSKDQLMPGRLFAHSTSVAGFVVTVAHGVCLIAFLNFFFLYVCLQIPADDWGLQMAASRLFISIHPQDIFDYATKQLSVVQQCCRIRISYSKVEEIQRG